MKRPRRTTIRDVAAAAGVSLTTVSDALSGKGRLPETTRTKVHEVAAQLHYRPNAIARGLREQGPGLLGISIASAKSATLSNQWYWASIAIHASDAMLSQGFAPVLLPYDVAALQQFNVPLDGVIVVDPLESDRVLSFFQGKKVRTVSIGYDPKNLQSPWIDDDNEAGIVALLSRTVAPGERIAAITFGPRKSYALDCLRGIRTWAADHGSHLGEFHCDELDDPGVTAALRTARDHKSQVIVAQNDRLAVRLLIGLKSLDVAVPDGIRVISATDAPELQNTSPSVTALRQHPDQLGQLAAKILFDLIHGLGTETSQLLPMEIVLRDSAPAFLQQLTP